jgi:hypothetical protein
VLPESAGAVYKKLGATRKHLHAIKAKRHGILMENIDGTWSVIDEFLQQHRDDAATVHETPQARSIQETAS